MERQLRAILAMDVVGFSKMMSEDEENTLRVLTDRRQVVDQIINEHGGRIFNTAGDSVIAEFASPVKAAECAVQIQNKNSTINKDLNEKEKNKIYFIHLNHTNPLLDKESDQYKYVISKGYNVAEEGMNLKL